MVEYSSTVQNGFVRLPLEVVKKLDCRDGDELEFIVTGNSVSLQKKVLSRHKTFSLEDIIADTYASTEVSP